MEAEFEEMLNICLTNAPSEFLRLINCALQLRPRTVANLILRHSRECPIEALAPLLHLVDNVVRRGGTTFRKVFENDLAELFEKAWKGSSRPIRSQLLKLYLGWRAIFPPALLNAIDKRMKASKSSTAIATPNANAAPNLLSSSSSSSIKRETPTPAVTSGMKRMKLEEAIVTHFPQASEPMSPILEEVLTPIPMRRIQLEGQPSDRDPNTINIESEDDASEDETEIGEKLQSFKLAEMMMKVAEDCGQEALETELPTFNQQGTLTTSMLNVYRPEVYEELSKGTKESKPRYLDWRFQIRFDRRKQNCRSRAWYAPSEAWAHECNPTDLSPTQLLQRLMKPRQWKAAPLSVHVYEKDPQLFCGMSGDRLEMNFDEESGKWTYVHCRRLSHEEALSNHVPDGTVCLNECFSDSTSTSFYFTK